MKYYSLRFFKHDRRVQIEYKNFQKKKKITNN